MKIIEARDGFVKIETENKIGISSFLEIKGIAKRYIAQVIRSKNNGTGFVVYAKILFIYDGSLKKYDKTLPDITAEIGEFSFELINNSFNYSNPIVAGKFIADDENILLSSDCFDSSTLISIDNKESSDIIIQNLAKQFKQYGKVLIIDMLGNIVGDKYVAGRDFKLPLNTESLQFMYDDCLSDATSESKEMIKDIFANLAEYSKQVKFLPFSTLKTIVDDMVEKSHIFKLLVLKNKLAKFETAGYFASNESDAKNLLRILENNLVVLDLSKIDGLFQNRYLSVILSELEKQNSQTRVIIEASNAVSKKNIKTLLYSENIKSTFATHSKFKYLADLKQFFKNYFVENTAANKEIFKLYSFFLESMDSNKYLIVGEGTNYIPVISKVEKYDVELKVLSQDSIAEEIKAAEYDTEIQEENIVNVGNLNIQDEKENDFSDVVVNSQNESEGIDEIDIESMSASDEVMENTEPEGDNSSIFEEEEKDALESELEVSIEEDHLAGISNADEVSDSELMSEDDTEQIPLSQEEPEEESEQETEEAIEEEENSDVEIPDNLVTEFEEIEEEVKNIEGQDVTDESQDSAQVLEAAEPEVLPLSGQEDDIGEFTELEVSELEDDDILVNMDIDDIQVSENTETINSDVSQEEIDRDIVEDVDKVFTTVKDDNISDSDLDFIDTLNEFDSSDSEEILREEENAEELFTSDDMETLNELTDPEEDNDGFLEPLEEISDSTPHEEEKEILETRESTTPIVPVYEAEIPEEDKVMSDDIEQGDSVIHAKYGSGIVEKMIKYGNKNLYSINFDNVGRRLLDPTLTEIKKA